MRASLLFASAAATFDYSSYENKYQSSSGGNGTHDSSGSQYSGAAGDWKKYEGASGNGTKSSDWKKYSDWQKYFNASKYRNTSESSYYYYMDSSDTYAGPFKSDPSILKLKGNVTALKAKEKEVEHDIQQVKKFVPKNFRDAPLGQFEKDLSDIRHMLKEAETNETKKEKPSVAENLTRHASSGAQMNDTSDAIVAKGTAFLARTDLITVSDAKVKDLEEKIKIEKENLANIKKYVPEQYAARPLNETEGKLAALKAELKAAKANASSAEGNSNSSENASTTGAGDRAADAAADGDRADGADGADRADGAEAAGAALLASARPTGSFWGDASLCFCATVSVLSLVVVLQRRTVNVDQRPLLG